MKEYGVFLGINENEAYKLDPYKLVVIVPSEFTSSTITNLHDKVKTIYGYLNIGSLEVYRPYYERFKDLTLGVYEDWPDEYWIDVSASSWHDFIINELAISYLELGFDGFFIDNTDVYYEYNNEQIFNGLKYILLGLKNLNTTLIINGGDIFVSECLEDNIATSLFNGVNQETVFTRIDLENNTYHAQFESEANYFKEYLNNVKNADLSVYLLEYKAINSLSKTIDAYCKENSFNWYNTPSLELT